MEIADATENGSAKTHAPACTVTAADPSAPNPSEAATINPAVDKWPGWPGHCVFRLIVPFLKVGSIIGRKGELIKKMCEETRARIRVLDGAVGIPDRIVLISGKEEPEAPLSPAMAAAIRVFKRVSGLPDDNGDAGDASCSIRLLVAAAQAISLIGKQGSLIKSLQESTGASVRVLSKAFNLYSSSMADEISLTFAVLKSSIAEDQMVRNNMEFQSIQSAYRLNRKNYLKWSQLVQTFLKGKGKIRHLLDTGPKKGTAGFKAWDEED